MALPKKLGSEHPAQDPAFAGYYANGWFGL